jgi:hypothetical protein
LRKTVVLFTIFACIALGAALFSGCGGSRTAGTSAPATAATAQESAPASRDYLKYIVGSSKLTEEQIAAAVEAIRCAEDFNIGSHFKASKVRCAEGWSRVSVEETAVPVEEAVGFDVYLKKLDETRWEVVQTGSGLNEEDLPAAPPAIFTD